MPKAQARVKDNRDWKRAGEECLTTALDRLEELARDQSDCKALESIIKTVGDVVGAGLYLGRGQNQKPQAVQGDDDD